MIAQFLKIIKKEVEVRANRSYAPKMDAYMKGHFTHIGLNMPNRKEALKATFLEVPKPNKDQLFPLMHRLWDMPHREYQHIAMDISKRYLNKINPDDLDDITQLITTKSWWDTVDTIASNLLGAALQNQGDIIYTYTDKLINSDDMWMRRSAIIFQLKYKHDVDFELLKSHILFTIDEREFFINKAQGWALRQYSKFNPAGVGEFIDTYRGQLSNLTIREGSKYLPR